MNKKKERETMHVRRVIIVAVALIALIALVVVMIFAMYLLQRYEKSEDYNYDDNYNSEVAEIIDGDTFRMQNGEIIRLICVDTPEKNQEGYDEAVSFLETRLLYSNREIKLEGIKTDKYGRSLRWVYVDGSLINKEIVEYGFGSVFEYEDENCSLMN